MTILVTGGTGTIGALVLGHLTGQGVAVRALTRNPDRANFPAGVDPVRGDLLDVAAMRAALSGVSTLFLLNAVAPQELSEALLTLNLAQEVGVRGIVYFSVFNGARFADVPHFAAKAAVERMIEARAIPATVLRPNCFMQNDAMFKDALLGPGLYPFPIGSAGVAMVDARDIAEVAALALLRRERVSAPLPHEVIDVVGPDVLTGAGNAALWTDLLGRLVRYAGDDLAPFEAMLGRFEPGWMAMDLRLMLGRFQADGMVPAPGAIGRLEGLLGRPLRTYAAFARETLAQWQA